MCCSSEQPLVESEFGTDPNNGCEGDYICRANIYDGEQSGRQEIICLDAEEVGFSSQVSISKETIFRHIHKFTMLGNVGTDKQTACEIFFNKSASY